MYFVLRAFSLLLLDAEDKDGGAASLEVSDSSMRSALRDLRTPLYGKASRNRTSPWTSELSKYSMCPKSLVLLGHVDKTSSSTHFPESYLSLEAYKI